MKILRNLLLAGLLALGAIAAAAQTTDPRTVTRGALSISGQRVAAGYEQLTLSSGTATALASIPTAKGGVAATLLVITVETTAVRFRDDGVDPTASVGFPIPVGGSYVYTGDPANLKFIRQSASNAVINVLYYF